MTATAGVTRVVAAAEVAEAMEEVRLAKAARVAAHLAAAVAVSTARRQAWQEERAAVMRVVVEVVEAAEVLAAAQGKLPASCEAARRVCSTHQG